MDKITGTLTGLVGITGSLSAQGALTGDLSKPESVPVPVYEGSYSFTPSAAAQTISILGKQATADITIAAIPQTYGLITWNGSTLTVS